MKTGHCRTSLCALALDLLVAGAGCGDSVSGPDPVEPTGPGTVVPYTEGIRIAWDHGTLRRPFEGPAYYPRMITLANSE